MTTKYKYIMSINNCEECGESTNVIEFVFFDTSESQYLCWECRKPHIMDRLDTDDEPWTPEKLEDGQTGFEDFL